MTRNVSHHIHRFTSRMLQALGIATLLTLSSCGDFLEESSQDHDYVHTWKDLNELLIGDGYMPSYMSNDFHKQANPGMFLHLFSDEVEENVTGGMKASSYDQHEYEFGYLTWQHRLGITPEMNAYKPENVMWTRLYKYINVVNNTLESIKKVPQQRDAEIDGVRYVTGQAYFLRAFYYFWLTNVYGQPYDPTTAATQLGVPIKTSFEVEDRYFTRNTVQECYDLIVSDLTRADSLLSLVTTPRKSIYRANAASTELLLSRVYLYMQQWEKAALYAQKVIDRQPALQDLNSDKSGFMSTGNPETIFSMGGDDLPRFMDYAAKCIRISNALYNSYESDDLRRQLWFWKYATFQGLTKQPATQTSLTANSNENGYYMAWYQYVGIQRPISSLFWLRTGEAYLNLAEAEAYMGHEDAARAAVNKIRTARINKQARNIEITSSGSKLITDLRNERRKELVGEGHRWFDLRRYRVCAIQPEKVSITHNYTYYEDRGIDEVKETHQFVLTEDDPSWTAPIPQEVLDFNVGMKGNGNKFREYKVVPTGE